MCTWDTGMKPRHCYFQLIPGEDDPVLEDVPLKVVVHPHLDFVFVLGYAKYSYEPLGDSMHWL